MPAKLAINGGKPVIPAGTILASPPTSRKDELYVLNSLRGRHHAWGPNCDALQEEWAQWNGNKHCIALTSGTAALHMALAAVGCGAGDEVITPAYSWTSSASCILHHQGIPVFVDVDPVFQNLDPSKLAAAITKRTKAIIVVHLHGVPAEMDAILAIAAKHGLPVIEDACQAHGARYQGRKVGTLGTCAAFSLNQNKMLSAGEGGLFVADDPAVLERGRALVLFGDFRDPQPGDDYHDYGLAWMYRYNDLCAAYARAQLTRLDATVHHARTMGQILREGLTGIPGLDVVPACPWGDENGYNFVCHVVPEAVGYTGPMNVFREAICAALSAEGVAASVWQRRILPEMAAIAARNAFGKGSPWRPHRSRVSYAPEQFPAALAHADSYFIIGGMRLPNPPALAEQTVVAVRKVFKLLAKLDIEAVAKRADTGLYERGWQKHASQRHSARKE